MPNRIEEILLEASTYYIKDQVIELANEYNKRTNHELETCYEESFKLILKQMGYEKDII